MYVNNIFIFVGMANVIVFVRYNGRWDQNKVYIDHETMGVLIPSKTMYIGLLNILLKALKLRPKSYAIGNFSNENSG